MEEKIGIIDTNEILDFWKEFNFELKRESLDKVCVEIKNQKATSINGRKKLNDLTKVFRSKSLEEQTAEVHDLLKSYQAEIDQLSRRSKFCESSFFNLYKSIYEAPDPVPAIEALIQALSSTSSYQIEIEKLKNEISQYEKEFQNLKNQDITIRRLEDQLSDYKLRIEDKVVEEVNKRTSEMEDHSESRIATIYEVQKAAEKRLASAIESMKQAQISAERAQTQLYDVTSQADMRCSALSVENSLLAEGADRLNARIAELENEVEVLRKTKQSANTASLTTPKKSLFLSSNEGNSSNLTSIMSLADEDADTLRLVITELREDMRRKEDAARAEKSHSEHILRDMTQQLTREKDQVTRLKMDLAERPLKEDYITVKRQLKLLQKVTFHLEDDDDDSNDVDPENTRPLDDKMQLESLLTGRLRTLDSEVSELRREVKLANQREIVSKNSIQSLRQSLEVSSTLIARLEADLELQTVINQQNMATISRTENSTDFSFITASPSTTNISYPSMYNRTKKGPRLSNTVPSTTVSGNSTEKSSRRHSFSLVENDVDLEKPDWDSTNESTTSIASPTGTTNIQSTTELGQEDGNIQSTESIEMPIVSPTMKQHKSINATTTSNTTSNVSAGNEMIASGHINTSTNNNNTAASNSMVSIIQGQRDRYKQKLTQVEGSLVDTQKQLKVISEAKQQLETDNIALYSKIRYLQSYQQSNSIDRDGNSNQNNLWQLPGSGESFRNKIPGLSLRLKSDSENNNISDVESRYFEIYEQKLNPFNEFSRVEKQRKLHDLSVADRIVLNTTIAFVSSQAGRRFVVVYISAMHIMVFFVLYYVTHFAHYGNCDPALPTQTLDILQ